MKESDEEDFIWTTWGKESEWATYKINYGYPVLTAQGKRNKGNRVYQSGTANEEISIKQTILMDEFGAE
jgi:hypothetical protein